MVLLGKILTVKIQDLELNVILFAKLLYELCLLVTGTRSQMVIAMESIDITVDIAAVIKPLQDMKQSDRIRTSGQTDNNNATVKESFTSGKFKDPV